MGQKFELGLGWAWPKNSGPVGPPGWAGPPAPLVGGWNSFVSYAYMVITKVSTVVGRMVAEEEGATVRPTIVRNEFMDLS